MKTMLRKNALPMLTALLALLLDQITKEWALGPLRDAGGSFVLLEGLFGLRYVENRGAAFGILQGGSALLAVLTGAILLFLFAYLLVFSKNLPGFPRWALWLMAGGALGNWIDRACRGFVVDFLEILLFDFPVFNGADCCVSVSFVMLALWIVFSKEERHG